MMHVDDLSVNILIKIVVYRSKSRNFYSTCLDTFYILNF